jgi:hypothetical protein
VEVLTSEMDTGSVEYLTPTKRPFSAEVDAETSALTAKSKSALVLLVISVARLPAIVVVADWTSAFTAFKSREVVTVERLILTAGTCPVNWAAGMEVRPVAGPEKDPAVTAPVTVMLPITVDEEARRGPVAVMEPFRPFRVIAGEAAAVEVDG